LEMKRALFVPQQYVLRTYVPLLNLNAYRVKRKIHPEMRGSQVGHQVKYPLPNPCSRTMDLGSTQPVTGMNTRNLPGGKWRPARKTDLTAIGEPTV
jgi:hypothetical protein